MAKRTRDKSPWNKWRRVCIEPAGERARQRPPEKLMGKMGLARDVATVLPPHFKHQLDRWSILHVECRRSITFDGYVKYEIKPCIKRLKSKTSSPHDHRNYVDVAMRLNHQEIITLIYYLEKACDWCTRQKLMDHEWERQQALRLKEAGEAVEKAREEREKREDEIDEIIQELSSGHESDSEEAD